MRDRSALLAVFAVGAALWIALFFYMNLRPPTLPDQLVFVLLLGGAVTGTVTPLTYLGNSKLLGRLVGRDLGRSLRQGALLGALASGVMALHLAGLLTPLLAAALALAVVAAELLLDLRGR